MSTLLAAVYEDHAAAERVRTQLVAEGFAMECVELTSKMELGPVAGISAKGISEKLIQYFGRLFPGGRADPAVQDMQYAVLSGQAVVAVQPRGPIELEHALEILDRGDPVELRTTDPGRDISERGGI